MAIKNLYWLPFALAAFGLNEVCFEVGTCGEGFPFAKSHWGEVQIRNATVEWIKLTTEWNVLLLGSGSVDNDMNIPLVQLISDNRAFSVIEEIIASVFKAPDRPCQRERQKNRDSQRTHVHLRRKSHPSPPNAASNQIAALFGALIVHRIEVQWSWNTRAWFKVDFVREDLRDDKKKEANFDDHFELTTESGLSSLSKSYQTIKTIRW